MSGSIDISGDGATLLIRFPYRDDLVDEVRLIPGRRWDREEKVWRVPASHVDRVVAAFRPHGFALAPEVSDLCGPADAPDGPGLFDPAPREPEAPPALSITILNERVRQAVRQSFPEPLWVVGEVLDFDKSRGRSHAFFALVEKPEQDSNPTARAEVVLFASTAERLARSQALAADGGFTLRDGIQVRVLVRVDLYPATGRYQLVIEDIDPSFTLGKLALQREAILAELRKRGLDRRNLQLPLPTPPLRVGVLTSLESDGWNDLRKQMEGAGLGFSVTCYPVRVQGPELRATMLAGLRWFADRADAFDVLCIVRGGGSGTDLAWFDDRDVAVAVANHPIKIVCGIGHERDQSVLDLITDSRKTPTAVGTHLVEQVTGELTLLASHEQALRRVASQRVTDARARVGWCAQQLLRVVQARVAGERQRLQGASRRLRRAPSLALLRRHDSVRDAGRRLVALVRRALERASDRLGHQQARQRLLDPRAVLRRGYALVRDRSGRVMTDAAAAKVGEDVTIALRDGSVRARPTEITIDEQESEGRT